MKIYLSSLVLLCFMFPGVGWADPPDAVAPLPDCAAVVKEYQQELAQKHSKKEIYAILLKLARAYADSRNFEKALETGQEAITLFPKKEDARLLVAEVYQHSELYELSSQEYLTILRYNHKSFNAHLALAQLYLKQGLMTQAMDYFRKAIAIKSTTELNRSMASCAENAGNLDLSISLLRQAIEKEERYDDLLHLGNLYAQVKKYVEAEENLSRAIALEPARVDGYLHLGLVFMGSNNLPLAEKYLRAALQKAPGEGSIHFFLAVLYFHQGKIGEAMRENAEAMWLSRTDILTAYTYKFDHFLSSLKQKNNE